MDGLPITGAALLHSLARLGVFTSLAAMAGAWAFHRLVLRPALSGWAIPVEWTERAERRVARQGSVAACVLVLAAMVRLVAQMLEFRVPGESVIEALRFIVLDTTWGSAWVAQVALGGLALPVFRTARARGRTAWSAAGLITMLACITPAFSGHASSVERWRAVAMVSDSAHVVAGGTWIGALLALLVVSGVQADGGASRRDVLLRLLVRFSPLALASAAVLAGTGTLAGLLHIPTLADLFGSTYGRVLLVKLAFVASVAGVGFHHWRRAIPALESGGPPHAFAKTIRVELILAFAVLAITALLTASPLPGD